MTEINKWIFVRPEKCEFEGPYECPSCGGHIIFDFAYIDQVAEEIVCPYCGTLSSVPEEDIPFPLNVTMEPRDKTYDW